MKIAISTSGAGLDAEIDPRFGRCQYFIIADSETAEFEVMDNSSTLAGGGAGISAAQAIVDMGAKTVLTGNCGPNAYQVLSSAGIQVITGVSGKVKDAIKDYRSGKLKASAQENGLDQIGIESSSEMEGNFGVRRGMGRGKNIVRHMTLPVRLAPQSLNLEQELHTLKVQSQALSQKLDSIQSRIEEIEERSR
jgi:predicted Fe-Mo cluster-binding NifX family protein